MKLKIAFAAILLFWMLTGCSSSGRHKAAVTFAPRQSVIIYWGEDGFPIRYESSLVTVLEQNGFRVTKTLPPGGLICKTSLHAGATMSARIELLNGSDHLVTAKAGNAGWGTLLAHGAAKANIINSAIDAFDKELRKARGGAPIPQAAENDYPAEATRVNAQEVRIPTIGQQLIDLQKAKDAGAISDAEYQEQKTKLLENK